MNRQGRFAAAALRLLPLIVLFAALSCGSVPKTHYYTVGRITPDGTAGHSAIDLTLGVAKFEAEGIYARDNLLYRSGEYEITPDYYRRWGVPPQSMLADAAVEYLRESGLFAKVIRMPSMNPMDLVLAGRIVRFEEIDRGGQPEVLVILDFSLLTASTHRLLWRREFSSSCPVTGMHTADAIVAAMENCIRSCLDQTVQALAGEGREALSAVE